MIDSRISTLPRPFVMTAYDTMQQTRDEAYPFTQEANFYWLTHIDEPGWLLIGDDNELHLVAPDRTPLQLLFEGGISHDDAQKQSGITSIVAQDEGTAMIKALARKHHTVYTLGVDPYDSYNTFTRNPAPARLRRQLTRTFKKVEDIRPLLTALRAQKQPAEINQIRHAIAITQDAFRQVHRHINDYAYEYEIEADMTRTIRRQGARGHAYAPIIAHGANALVMHYDANNDSLLQNDLVLMDVGAQYGAFAADITRTYARGDISKRQQHVHATLVAAHAAIIACIKPGVTYGQYQAQSDAIMKDALVQLGLMANASDNDAYRRYFPHAISHGLGIDVHESLGGQAFAAGMVLTVEPGIYIPEEGIGIRVEDDILVTADGNENLSRDLPLSV